MKPIVGANYRGTRIDIPLPVDETGQYAYDEDMKPVEGREPVILSVPRFDCMTREQFKQLNKALSELEERKDDNGEPLSPQERSFETVLIMLRPFITDEQAALLEGLRLFELEQIATRVQEASTISVGELLASTGSSKSTAGRSKQTSSQ